MQCFDNISIFISWNASTLPCLREEERKKMKMVKKKKEIQTCILFPLHHTDVGFSVHTRGDKKSIILFMSQRIDSDISQAIPFSYQCWTPSGMVFKLLRHLYLIGTWKWFMLVLMVVVLNISFIINTIYDFISMHMIMITCIFVTCFGFLNCTGYNPSMCSYQERRKAFYDYISIIIIFSP